VREWTLIYDGDCEFCRRLVALVKRLDWKSRLSGMPFQGADLERYGVSHAAAEQAMHLVAPSGGVWSGAAAARELARLLPALRPAAWLFHVPGVMALAERVYRWIARRRHRLGCGSGTCRRGDTARRPDE
jgi:predicted DCC family thiol-disulfide oxidoreductase YuxK